MVVCSLAIVLVFFIRCAGDSAGTGDPRGNQYAGAEACKSCHKDVANSYTHDHHFNTSGPADRHYLAGVINPSNDTVHFREGQMVVLSKQDSDFYQTSYKNNEQGRTQKIDLAIGSAVKAQTYLYWKESQLYQMPVTYLTNEKVWTNSPGFPIYQPFFTRVIPSRCLECHTSFVRSRQERDGAALRLKQVYEPASIVYGIDCERCHGPAANHVKFHQENPDVKEAKYITSSRSLSRQQKMDLCGTCHSGDPLKLRSIFNFLPGDTLTNYYMISNVVSGEPDVHGMQSQLLQQSKCFLKSEMTCINCHGPHNSAGNTAAIITQCNSCHKQVTHTVDVKTTDNNCITCHMPLRPSKSLDFNNGTEAHTIQYMLRTHRIAVYPKEIWK
jgi:hypothetical protein